jgi:DDE superfamily endonuclease
MQPLSYLPPLLATAFAALARCLHKRSAARLPLILCGILFAKGRRTVTSWFRAAAISHDFRCAYTTVCATGRHTDQMATSVLQAVTPLLDNKRLRVAIDDTPTSRYGPRVEGAGIHHNPTPGPAGERHVYGHVWVTLAALATHKDWGCIALPLQAQLYVRKVDLPKLPPERPREFRTKLQMAVDQLAWLKAQAGPHFEELWVVADGAYAKRPFLKGARQHGFTVVSRLRKDAALWSLPEPVKPGHKRGRGRPRIYGKDRISLAKRAGQTRGWQEVECVQYGEKVTKTIKTFLATWRPAGGVIRVVLVKEEADNKWLPFFSPNPEATAVEILEAMADRGSEENLFKDVKEVEGAGEQQVRNINSNEGCFNLNLWMHSLVEAWAWDKSEAELVDRSASPWDGEPRRPSHADKRKALQREVLQAEIEAALTGRPSKQEFRALVDRLLDLAV